MLLCSVTRVKPQLLGKAGAAPVAHSGPLARPSPSTSPRPNRAAASTFAIVDRPQDHDRALLITGPMHAVHHGVAIGVAARRSAAIAGAVSALRMARKMPTSSSNLRLIRRSIGSWRAYGSAGKVRKSRISYPWRQYPTSRHMKLLRQIMTVASFPSSPKASIPGWGQCWATRRCTRSSTGCKHPYFDQSPTRYVVRR